MSRLRIKKATSKFVDSCEELRKYLDREDSSLIREILDSPGGFDMVVHELFKFMKQNQKVLPVWENMSIPDLAVQTGVLTPFLRASLERLGISYRRVELSKEEITQVLDDLKKRGYLTFGEVVFLIDKDESPSYKLYRENPFIPRQVLDNIDRKPRDPNNTCQGPFWEIRGMYSAISVLGRAICREGKKDIQEAQDQRKNSDD